MSIKAENYQPKNQRVNQENIDLQKNKIEPKLN